MWQSKVKTSTNPRPWAFVASLALILAVESFFGRRPEDFGYFDFADWTLAGRAARREAPNCDVLCFGDSTLKLGLQPVVIERRLGCRVYNLAVSAGPAPTSYFLLRRALRAGARPRAIVVDFHPHLMSVGPAFSESYWCALLNPSESWELAWQSHDAGLFARIMTEALVPSVRGRPIIRPNLLSALKGETTRRREALWGYWRNWNQNRGALAISDAFRSDGSVDAQKRNEFVPAVWNVDPVAARYVERFLELASAQGIKVYWLIPPLVPALESLRASHGLSARYDAFVCQVLRKFHNVTVLDARRSDFQNADFADTVHLNRRGAVALSSRVAEHIDRGWVTSAADARWFDLPADRPAIPEIVLEDHSRSLELISSARVEVSRSRSPSVKY
jgi:hypothetical protein